MGFGKSLAKFPLISFGQDFIQNVFLQSRNWGFLPKSSALPPFLRKKALPFAQEDDLAAVYSPDLGLVGRVFNVGGFK